MMKIRCFNTEKLYKLLKDDCLKESQYWCDRKKYNNTDDLVKSNERDETVVYILETCERDEVAFGLETFALSVSLLDRFLACFKVKSKYLECLALACLYIASKVKEEKEKCLGAAQFLEMSDAKFSQAELLRMELMILNKFDWCINDVTAIDFCYLLHALLVDKHNQIEPNNSQLHVELNRTNKWQKISHATNTNDNNHRRESVYTPHDLDFLHLIESQLKHCLCVNELTTNFKPHVLAFSLISLQVEKDFALDTTNYAYAMLDLVKSTLPYTLKLNNESVDECKEQIKVCLTSLESSKIFFDHFYLNMLKVYRTTAKFMSPPLSTVVSPLCVIEEEDEEEEEVIEEDENDHFSIQLSRHDFSNLSLMPVAWMKSGTFADVLKKRKLSENSNSDGEDFEF
jgi:hypothetical protein